MKKPPTLHFIVLALTFFLISAEVASAKNIELFDTRVPLNYERPDQLAVGMLEYRGGLSIKARDPKFGGLSSLLVSADGKLMLAASDNGMWFSANLNYDDDGILVGLSSAKLAPITGTDGKPLAGRYRDAEGLARADDGAVFLAFEQHHRILRFALSGQLDADRLSAAIPDLVTTPAELAEFNSNAAMEALVTLDDGGLLILTEGLDNDRSSKPGWIMRNGTAAARLVYNRADRFRPTGATRLADGDLIVVERSYSLISGVAALLRRVSKGTIQPGAHLDGPELARIAPPLTIDNTEGIATRRDNAGHTLIYLLSDNNYSVLQRTLLLMFKLSDKTD